jgi:hypothetical protein
MLIKYRSSAGEAASFGYTLVILNRVFTGINLDHKKRLPNDNLFLF